MINISGIPHVKTRVPLTLWYAALVVTLFSLSTSLIQRDSDKTHQQANMASAVSSLLPF